MSNTFFPLNEDTFIERIMNDINELDTPENWLDVYHERIDYEVSTNGDKENIMIINEYADGVYEAIQLYQDHFGEFDVSQKKSVFYGQLAFVSIYEKFYEVIENLVDDL
jgi:hypothetical protein